MSDVADRYRRLADRFTTTVDAVPESAWDRPSPCDDWTAREVVGHVVGTEWEFLAARDVAPERWAPGGDPLAAWPRVRDAVQAVLDDPTTADKDYQGWFGPTTIAATIDRFYSMDLVVHRWDLARATGLRDEEAIDPDDVERVLADAEALGDNLRQPGVCGPAVTLGPGASRQDQLLAYLGRHPLT